MVVMPINYMEIENILVFAKKYSFQRVQLLPPILCKEQYKLNKDIVKFLAQQKYIYLNMAKKYGITLINKLPEEINYKDDEHVIDSNDVNSMNKAEDINKEKQFDCDSQVQINIKVLDKGKLSKNKYKKEKKYEMFFYTNIKSYNNRLFCLEPFKKIVIDNLKARPTCLCSNVKCIYDVNLLSKKEDYNNFIFRKYRQSILLNKQNEICLKDCLDNIFINNSKSE